MQVVLNFVGLGPDVSGMHTVDRAVEGLGTVDAEIAETRKSIGCDAWKGSGSWRSINATCRPWRASPNAAAAPTMPPPTIIISN
jgi:hypothetical protein